jgi:hypothetical protein
MEGPLNEAGGCDGVVFFRAHGNPSVVNSDLFLSRPGHAVDLIERQRLERLAAMNERLPDDDDSTLDSCVQALKVVSVGAVQADSHAIREVVAERFRIFEEVGARLMKTSSPPASDFLADGGEIYAGDRRVRDRVVNSRRHCVNIKNQARALDFLLREHLPAGRGEKQKTVELGSMRRGYPLAEDKIDFAVRLKSALNEKFGWVSHDLLLTPLAWLSEGSATVVVLIEQLATLAIPSAST